MPTYFNEQLESDTLLIASMQNLAVYQLPTIEQLEEPVETRPEIRVTAELVQNGNEEPVFVITHHAKSSSKDESVRQAELERIQNYIIELQREVFRKTRFVVTKAVVMGDLNENLLVNRGGRVQPDLDKIAQVVVGLGADSRRDGDTRLIDAGVADNIQTKTRGGLVYNIIPDSTDKPLYNGYINPQPVKDGEVVDDSKNALFAVELANYCVWEWDEDEPTFSVFQPTGLPSLSLDGLNQRLIRRMATAGLLNFNQDNTGYKDHADAQLTAFGFKLLAKSFLPLSGKKGLQNPEEVFTSEALANADQMLELQAHSTYVLYEALHRHAGSTFPLTTESNKMRGTLKQLNQDFKTNTLEGLNEGIGRIQAAVAEWMASREYQMVSAFLLPQKKQAVERAMASLFTEGGKVGKTVGKAAQGGLDKNNVVGDIVKLLFQTQGQEVLGGYAKINGQSVVYKQNVIKQYAQDLQTSVLGDEPTVIVVTEATTKENQSAETLAILNDAVSGSKTGLTDLTALSRYVGERHQELEDFYIKLLSMDTLEAQKRQELYQIRSFFDGIGTYENELAELSSAYPEHSEDIEAFLLAIGNATRTLDNRSVDVNGLLEFKATFNREFLTLTTQFDAYESKTWQNLDLFVKNVLGVCAVVTVLPALYVAATQYNRGGFYGTFFKESVTKALGETPLPTVSLGV